LFVGDDEPNGQNILPIEPRTLLRFSRLGRLGADCSDTGVSVMPAGGDSGAAEASVGAEMSPGSEVCSGCATSAVICFEASIAGVGGGRWRASVSVICLMAPCMASISASKLVLSLEVESGTYSGGGDPSYLLK